MDMLARWSTRTVPAHHHGDASPTSPSSTASKKRVSRSLFEIESWARHPPSLWLTSWVTPSELSHWPNAQLSRVWQSAVPLPPSPPSPSPHGISTTTLATGHWSRWVFIVFHHDMSTFSMFRHPYWSVPLCGTPRAELHPWLPIPRCLEWIKVHRARRPFGNLVRFMAEFAHFMTFAVAS